MALGTFECILTKSNFISVVEYITTLEADVAERDRLIDAIRTELGSTKSENYALKQEIEILKKSLLQANPAPVLPPPAPLPAVSAAATVAARNSAPSPAPSSPLLAPNPNKDLPSSPRLASTRSGFWGGGSGSNPFGAMGGFTPVHTTLVPELSLTALAEKGLLTPPSKPLLQENLNPTLNGARKPTASPQSKATDLHSASHFDSFADLNPFTMKSMDLYRMSLWSNVGTQKQQQQHQPHQAPHLNGLAAALLPHYFAAATTKSSTSLVVASKTPKHQVLTPSSEPSQKATPQEAMLASLASQTLLAKLGSAFWEAFSGQSPRKGVDADKVRKVLEGKAVVRVVDIDEPASQSKLKRVATTTPITASPKVPQKSVDLKSCQTRATELLEESMRSLSISKRGPL